MTDESARGAWTSEARVEVGADGLRLHVRRAGEGPPLLALHGFTGTGDAWRDLAGRIGDLRTVVAPDLIGHGRSDAPADPARYRMEHSVRDLVALLDTLEVERADVLGYSLGGRTALALALDAPERVRSLVLESASPGIADPEERARRRADDARLADDVEREGLPAFMERWERLPLWESQQALPDEVRAWQRRGRLSHTPTGLANSLRGMGQGAAPAVGDRLAELRMPVLLVAGALDAKYARLMREMRDRIPEARLVVVEHAGHAVHLEGAEEFAERVGGWLREG